MFILGGSSQASHIPVVQYLPYGSIANFGFRAPMDSTQEWIGDSDLCGIKIGPQSRPLKYTMCKVKLMHFSLKK